MAQEIRLKTQRTRINMSWKEKQFLIESRNMARELANPVFLSFITASNHRLTPSSVRFMVQSIKRQ